MVDEHTNWIDWKEMMQKIVNYGFTDESTIEYDGYQELANAIFLQAVEDYRTAVLDRHILNRRHDAGEISENDYIKEHRKLQGECVSIARFFKSSWGRFLVKFETDDVAKLLADQATTFGDLGLIAVEYPEARTMTMKKWEENPQEYIKKYENVFTCPICKGHVGMRYRTLSNMKNGNEYIRDVGWRLVCDSCGMKMDVKKKTKKKKKGVKNARKTEAECGS